MIIKWFSYKISWIRILMFISHIERNIILSLWRCKKSSECIRTLCMMGMRSNVWRWRIILSIMQSILRLRSSLYRLSSRYRWCSFQWMGFSFSLMKIRRRLRNSIWIFIWLIRIRNTLSLWWIMKVSMKMMCLIMLIMIGLIFAILRLFSIRKMSWRRISRINN